ncbi:pyridoxal-phosphate dependent enzyme [Rhizobium lusitanum]|uniref:pyridoxal-phosphate dependent enzyme n=1 Tax=Rhizobium lusitanum TaxID=293958 RepID=UPI00195623DE|nr:pyridoxal-phosphate dependent enzyme [Rhizobium lusitanum]MBM7049282.1 pyridoxal-phosphate dependent enzyme [Rhizobium lusitanum]
MTRIYNSFSDLIGNTPLLELHNYRRNRGLDARILAKTEYFNPAGSVKDRIAWGIVRDAEERGKIRPGDLLAGSRVPDADVAILPLNKDKFANLGAVKSPQQGAVAGIFQGIVPISFLCRRLEL